MSEPKLNAEHDFLVRESRTINFIAGGFMLVVFFASMMVGAYGWANIFLEFAFYLFPALLQLPGANAIKR
jgi:hypothetical protein